MRRIRAPKRTVGIITHSERNAHALKKEPQPKIERWYGFSLFLPKDYRRGVYFKTGIHKWVWKMTPEKDQSTTAKRITYVDEVRIGNEKATYQDVSPKVTKAQK